MKGWLYIIKNGDLYKIGITKNLDRRMRELKPDYVIAKIYSRDFKDLEKEIHNRFKNFRIPQTEYFRLDHTQIREIKQRISKLNYPIIIIFIELTLILLFLFLIIFLFLSLYINSLNTVFFNTLLCMENISFCLSFLSFFIKSKKYFDLLSEFNFRLTRFFILILFAFFFKFVSRVLFFI